MKVDPSALRYVALSPHAKGLAQDMYQALWSFIMCVLVTVIVSLATKPAPDSRIDRLGIRADRGSFGGESSVVSEADFLGWRGDGGFCRTEHYFLVEDIEVGEWQSG